MARYRRSRFSRFHNKFKRNVKRYFRNSRRGFIKKVNRGGIRL